MKYIIERLGISASLLIILGCILKALHLQGAAAVLTIGFIFFSLVFLPALIFSQLKKKNYVYSLGGFTMISLMLGVLFKIMHWPYAGILISWSVTISLFGIMPLYFIKVYSKNNILKTSKEERVKQVLVGVFIIAMLSMWYSMIDLSSIQNPYTTP